MMGNEKEDEARRWREFEAECWRRTIENYGKADRNLRWAKRLVIFAVVLTVIAVIGRIVLLTGMWQ